MNVYAFIASASVLITVFAKSDETKKESNKDVCNSNESCVKCLESNLCFFVHCIKETKGICTKIPKNVPIECDISREVKNVNECSEDVNTTTVTNQPISTTAATIPVPSTRDGTGTGKGFSGPSFIGGIVLAFGLMAIAVILFKFYKARTEANYHTL